VLGAFGPVQLRFALDITMSAKIDRQSFESRKRRLQFLMALMLVFMVAAPLLAPIIYADEFSHFKGPGLYFFYIATPVVFGGLFVRNLFFYRQFVKRFKDQDERGTDA
jgi:uncharacterized membrane protein YhaH (DUF805 family)